MSYYATNPLCPCLTCVWKIGLLFITLFQNPRWIVDTDQDEITSTQRSLSKMGDILQKYSQMHAPIKTSMFWLTFYLGFFPMAIFCQWVFIVFRSTPGPEQCHYLSKWWPIQRRNMKKPVSGLRSLKLDVAYMKLNMRLICIWAKFILNYITALMIIQNSQLLLFLVFTFI